MKIKVVLSDDLTGAMDAGVQLTKKNYKVKVIFDIDKIEYDIGQDEIIILDTETRNIPSKDAYEKINNIVDQIDKLEWQICYKKTDSTLRGNLGSEMEVILNRDNEVMIVYAPALPHNGRTTINGKQYIDGKLLTNSDLAKDPFSPVKSAYIPELIASQSKVSVSVIDIDTVNKGMSYVAEELITHHADGNRIVVIDACNDDDLGIIGAGVKESGLNILPAGSAGLFPHMFIDIEKDNQSSQNRYYKSFKSTYSKPVIVISGSPAEASKRQISTALLSNVAVINLSIAKASKGGQAFICEYERIIREFTSYIEAGKNVILDGAGESKTKIYNERIDDSDRLMKDSSNIQSMLSHVVADIIHKFDIAGIMISGGDTAVSIFRELGAFGILVFDEAEPYIPVGILQGGEFQGLPVITKAGGFGTENAFLEGICYLQGM